MISSHSGNLNLFEDYPLRAIYMWEVLIIFNSEHHTFFEYQSQLHHTCAFKTKFILQFCYMLSRYIK